MVWTRTGLEDAVSERGGKVLSNVASCYCSLRDLEKSVLAGCLCVLITVVNALRVKLLLFTSSIP